MLNVIIGSVSQSYNDLLNYFSGQWNKTLKKLSDVHVMEAHFDTMTEIDQDMINIMMKIHFLIT